MQASEDSYAQSFIGRVIDERYRVEAILGEGGMGCVFVAEHVKLRKRVALKVILPNYAGNAELAERFAREAMVSAQLSHPNVSSATDYGALPEGGAYLVMEIAEGHGLRAYMTERAGVALACHVGAQIADALVAAHARGIVHRDLKPENVIVAQREDGSLLAKVLDFGIARVADAGPSPQGALTRLGAIMGTPGYMAPEQTVGEQADARADLYALGVVLWEATTGRRLFDAPDFGAFMLAQIGTMPPRLHDVVPSVPLELDVLVSQLLEKDRQKRPADAVEPRNTLRALAAQTPWQSSGAPRSSVDSLAPTIPQDAALARTSEARAVPVTRASEPPPPARKGVLAIVIVGLAIGACGLGIAMLMDRFVPDASPNAGPPAILPDPAPTPTAPAAAPASTALTDAAPTPPAPVQAQPPEPSAAASDDPRAIEPARRRPTKNRPAKGHVRRRGRLHR